MKLSLKFDKPDLEKNFIAEYTEIVQREMLLVYWPILITYGLFGLLDRVMMPSTYHSLWTARYFVIMPCSLILFLATYIRWLRAYNQLMYALNVIVLSFGVIATKIFADSSEQGYRTYYAGLMIIIMGVYLVFRLRFRYALFCSFVIIAAYELTALFIDNMPGNTETRRLFVHNNFFFITANIMGLSSVYFLEKFIRISFLQKIEITEKHSALDALMGEMKFELNIARSIQTDTLPERTLYLEGAKISSLFMPMEDLGGDLYDFIRFGEKNLLGIFISDVSGHGIPAALVSGMIKTLNITSGNSKFSPPEFLSRINRHITGIIGNNFLTAVYMLYDSESRLLKFSRAGHPYPVLIRRGEIKHLAAKGGLIGVSDTINFEEYTISLERGDKVLLYTDGLIEGTDPDGILFEKRYFGEVLPAITECSVDEIVSLSYSKLIEFQRSDRLKDDICIVGLEVL